MAFRLEQLLPPVLGEQVVPTQVSELDSGLLSPADLALQQEQLALSQVSIWVAYSRELQAMLSDRILGEVDRLAAQRLLDDDSTSTQDNVAKTAAMLGFVLPNEVMQRVVERNVRPLLPQLSRYVEDNSTIKWTEFLTVLMGGDVRVTYLFTRDYIEFIPVPGGTLIQVGGQWFRSTHIDISIDYLGYSEQVTGQAFSSSVGRSILEEYMPANLVIERFSFYREARFPVYIAVGSTTKMARRKRRAVVGIDVYGY